MTLITDYKTCLLCLAEDILCGKFSQETGFRILYLWNPVESEILKTSYTKSGEVKMRMLKALIIALICLVNIPIASAAPEDGQKIGYVDLKRAVWGSKAGQDAQSALKKEYNQAQTSIDSKSKELEKLKGKLTSKRDSLKLSAIVEKEEELIEKEKSLKRKLCRLKGSSSKKRRPIKG